jgi:hypothetical protein
MAKTQAIVFASAAARTTTGNSGAIKIPEDCSAIMFIADANTVSGTSPTLDISLEISNDEGTTWFGVSRFTQITSATERFLTQPFFGQSVIGTEGVTEANWEMAEAAATGGALVQPCVQPSHMRAVWTIGGTNPSFNFTLTALTVAPR